MLILSQNIAQHLGSDPFGELMAIKGEVFRKQPNRETLRVFIGGSPYFIKKHTGASFFECLKNLFVGKQPVIGATQEYKAIKRVTELGIPTTPLMGYGKRGHNPLTERSFILTVSLENTISLETFCQAWAVASPGYALKKAILTEVARLTRMLHEHHCYHRDLYLCHFLMQLNAEKKLDTASPIKLYLIDLHRMKQCKKIARRWQHKDLAALLFSALDAKITFRDLLRFMKTYTGKSVRTLLKERERWSPVLNKAVALYLKSHGDLPKQSWMQGNSEALPRKVGAYDRAIPLLSGSIIGTRALRVMPGERWVIQGTYQSAEVVVKLFTKRAHFLRECAGYDALIKAGIPTLDRLGLSKTLQGQHAVIYRYIPSTHLNELSGDLISLMARMHAQGVYQADCHLDNFLVDEQGQLVVCDLGAIVSRDLRALSERAALDNLALLFAQCPVIQDAQNESLFELYVRARKWPIDSGLIARFWAAVKTHREYRLRKWLEKTQRSSTLFKSKWRLSYRMCMRRDFANLYSQTLVNYPQAYFNSHADYLKKGGSATVVQAQLGETTAVIKRYNIKNWQVYLKRLFGSSKARRAWRMSHGIQALGIATPLPLAMIEQGFLIFPRESYFISQWVAGHRLDQYTAQDLEPGQQRKLVEAIGDLMESLRLGACCHGDLKASNMIWDGDRLYLMDCEGARFIKNPLLFNKAHENDWKRLLANWPSSRSLYKALELWREQ